MRSTAKHIQLFSILIFLSSSIFCQEYNYVHYDVKDGLAGSTVYAMVQDRDGFMWFATETGLSRFDGTHFKNFYTSDGLPDNEIIKLFVDSKNRVWIIPFKNSICYYWKGKIHNQENDSLLKNLRINEDPVSVDEDKGGNLLLSDKRSLSIIGSDNQILLLNIFQKNHFVVDKAGLDSSGNFVVQLTIENTNIPFIATISNHTINKMYSLLNGENTIYLSRYFQASRIGNSVKLIVNNPQKTYLIDSLNEFMSMSCLNDSIISFNTVNGEALLFNINRKRIIQSLHVHEPINSVFEDNEKNIWISTHRNGIYRLPSEAFVNYISKNYTKSVFCIQKEDSLIYAGTDNFNLWTFHNHELIKTEKILKGATQGRITSIINTSGKGIIIGTDVGLIRLSNTKIKDSLYDIAVKSIVYSANDKILVTSNAWAAYFDVFKLHDTLISGMIWRGRATCACPFQDDVYVGTLNGLYVIRNKGKNIYLGDYNKIFSNRINSISKSNNGILWVATNGGGIVGLTKNKIAYLIDESKGLTSNICRNIFVTANSVWVATDRGLNKISYSDSNYKVTSFTTADGLSSDIINAVYADGDDIYVGTPNGLDFFNANQISKKSICSLHIIAINTSLLKPPPDSTNFLLEHKDNNIEFQFVGISFKSAGKISYQYRLIGLDSNWKSTTATSLNFTSLPSGNYELQLRATNKFGVQSNLIKVPFSVAKTIFEKTWMRLLLIALTIAIVWLIINYRIKKIKQKEKEKSVTLQRINELEQMALKSQMNPHFIFNCLNSIQHYVIDKDIIGANEFITSFSRLIRLTLDNSSKALINLNEEISYIAAYLEIEQKRFVEKFSFVIDTDDIVTHDYFIPPMLLQPYIENSIRHGIRYRTDEKGKITLRFRKKDDYLLCIISDNGIGRKKAQLLKSRNAIEYQSKGMDLTARRIDMYNKTHSSKIIIDISDPEDSNGSSLGTEVKIYFPVNEIQKENEYDRSDYS